MKNSQSREVLHRVNLNDECTNQEGKLNDVPSCSQEISGDIPGGQTLDKTGFSTIITHHDTRLTNSQSMEVLGLANEECVGQENKLNADDASLPPQEKNVNLFNGEEDVNSVSIISQIDVHQAWRTTNCAFEDALGQVSSYDTDATEEEKLSDASSCSLENNKNLFNDEEHLNDNDISIKAGLSTDTHRNEMAGESEKVLDLPVTSSFRSCDQQDNNVQSAGTIDNYQDVSFKKDSEDDSSVGPCANRTTSIQDLKNSDSVGHRAMDKVKQRKHVCDVCAKEFRRKGALVQHTRVHTGERPFACHLCGKSFMDKKTLTRHVRIHTSEKTFVCEICGKAFREKKNLMQHVFIHTGEQPYSCEVCQKKFKARRDLRIHLTTHSDDKPFACDVCQKQFHSKTALNKHLRNHYITKEKIYVCGVCQKAFKNNSSLNDHLIAHTGDKPHTCPVCQCSFTRKSSLSRHRLRHTGEKPFVCKLCLKVFSLKYHLTQHVRTHSDEKPFVCEVCCSAFRNISALNAHFATHMGERPHACDVCQRAFTRRSSLKRHLERHHGRLADPVPLKSDQSAL